MHINRWSIVFWIILVLGPAWIWWSRVPVDAQVENRVPTPALQHPAPSFTLTTLRGEEFDLDAVRGKPIVLNFWATWCGPCQRELPALQAAAERYADEVLIVGVDQAEEPETVQEYVDRLGLTFPIPLDTDNEIFYQYNVNGLPTTFFIDSDGVIRGIWSGEMNSITLAEHIAEILP